jgi:hypothetical protein
MERPLRTLHLDQGRRHRPRQSRPPQETQRPRRVSDTPELARRSAESHPQKPCNVYCLTPKRPSLRRPLEFADPCPIRHQPATPTWKESQPPSPDSREWSNSPWRTSRFHDVVLGRADPGPEPSTHRCQPQDDLYTAPAPTPLRLSLVMIVNPVWIFFTIGLPLSAASAWATPS